MPLVVVEELAASLADEVEKKYEKEAILVARKKAFGEGDNYLYYPPWRK